MPVEERGDALEVPDELATFSVDAWLDVADRVKVQGDLSRMTINGTLALELSGELDYALGMVAFRRYQRALNEWAAERGLALSDIASLISRARHVALTRAQE